MSSFLSASERPTPAGDPVILPQLLCLMALSVGNTLSAQNTTCADPEKATFNRKVKKHTPIVLSIANKRKQASPAQY
jgi:hypothetical protein